MEKAEELVKVKRFSSSSSVVDDGRSRLPRGRLALALLLLQQRQQVEKEAHKGRGWQALALGTWLSHHLREVLGECCWTPVSLSPSCVVSEQTTMDSLLPRTLPLPSHMPPLRIIHTHSLSHRITHRHHNHHSSSSSSPYSLLIRNRSTPTHGIDVCGLRSDKKRAGGWLHLR